MLLPPLPSPLAGALGRPVWNEARAPGERARLNASAIRLDPVANERIVLVTGYLAGASSASALQPWLLSAGYDVCVADVGRNAASSTHAAGRIAEALMDGDKPSILIGHSRGGQQCRVASQRHPSRVSQLITLGAPVRMHLPRQIVLRSSIEALRVLARFPFGTQADPEGDAVYENDLLSPFDVDVPWTTVWSKTDGIVEWQACLDERATSLEVRCSHSGMLASVPSFEAIAAVLNNRGAH